MTIDLSPELEKRLREAAAQQGITPEALVEQALEERLPPDPSNRIMWNGMTADEWIREFNAWASSHKDTPPLPPEAYERASFYEE